jgi:hypothetical protein
MILSGANAATIAIGLESADSNIVDWRAVERATIAETKYVRISPP